MSSCRRTEREGQTDGRERRSRERKVTKVNTSDLKTCRHTYD